MRSGMKTGTARRSLTIGFAMAALVAGFGWFAADSHAQEAPQARMNIEFPFVAAGKDMPAGTYEFSLAPGRVVLRPKDAKLAQVTMPVVTRLGRHDEDTTIELVFDKVEGKSILSELWLPGSDGYLLVHGTADHGHRVVVGPRPAKRN